MQFDLEAEHGFLSISRKELAERIKSAFFETVCFIGIPPAQKEGTKMPIFRMLIFEVRWLLQMLPYIEDEETQNNGVFVRDFWFTISCIRPDMVMSYLQAAWVWMILVWFGVIACWALFALVFALTFFKKRTHPRLRKLLQVFGQLLLSLISVPSANILLATWFPDSRFGNGITDSMRSWAGYISLIVYFGLICFQCTMILANFEFDITQKIFRAKSEMDHDFLTLVVAQTAMVSYYLLYSNNKLIHNFLVLAMSLPLAIRCFLHLPYYRSTATAITAWSRTALAWSAFAMLVGQQVNPLCSLLLVVVVNVCLAFILFLGFDSFQLSAIKKFAKRLSEPIREHQYELGMRQYILQAIYEPDSTRRLSLGRIAITKIDTCISSSLHSDRKRLILLKYILYLNILSDERAARVCLSQALMHHSSITSSFLEFKAKWMLSSSSELEEIVFLRYLEKLEAIKSEDKTVCRLLNDLWSELGSVSPDKSRVMKLSREICTGIKFLKQEFKILIKNFPGGFESYDLYGSFVEDVLGQVDEGRPWRRKAASLYDQHVKKESKDDKESVGFFDPNAGVILADTSTKNFGTLVFMNAKGAEILEFNPKSLSLHKLTSVIPAPYSGFHLKIMKRFISKAGGMTFSHPDQIPMLKSNGFIVFCAVKMYLTSNGGLPLIAIAFKPLKGLKEGAILSEHGVVESHTQEFPRLLGYTETHIEGGDLVQMRPNLMLHRGNGTSLSFRMFSNRPYCGMFTTGVFGATIVNYFYVFKSEYDYTTSYLTTSVIRPESRQPSMFFQSFELEKKDGVKFKDEDQLASLKAKMPGPMLISYVMDSTVPARSQKPELIELMKKVENLYRLGNFLALGMVKSKQTVALVVLNVVGIVLVNNQLVSLINQMMIGEVAAKGIYASQITTNTRNLYFNVSAIVNLEHLKGLQMFTQLLDTAQLDIWHELDVSQSAAYRTFYTEKMVKTWEKLDGEVHLHPRSLIDALSTFVAQVIKR